MSDGYLSLEALAAALALPRRFLKDLAMRRDIPALDVNGRLRFDEMAVRQALGRLASGNADDGKGAGP